MLQGAQYLQWASTQIVPTAVRSGAFRSLASFSAPVQTQGPTGTLVGTFMPVNGLQNIPCLDAPQSIRVVPSDEKKSVPRIEAGQYRHLMLDGWYPLLNNAAGQGWQVTVDGILYDLIGSDEDSQHTQTRCKCQLVTI